MKDCELAAAYYAAKENGDMVKASEYANEAIRRGMVL